MGRSSGPDSVGADSVEQAVEECIAGGELAPADEFVWFMSLLDIAGADVSVGHVASRAGELLRSAVDSSKLAADRGWVPQVTLNDGLQQTYEWVASCR